MSRPDSQRSRAYLSTFVVAGLVASIAGAGSARGTEMVWHAETMESREVDSHHADRPINPASLAKMATTLWALERLGPDHRFETRFGYRGSLDRARGILDGDLVVEGGGDPDFHVENAFLVAKVLNDLGVVEVHGSLLVDERFWIGWEGGTPTAGADPDARARKMAGRLREALDPARWSRATRAASAEFRVRRGLDGKPSRVTVSGAGAWKREADGTQVTPLLIHRSNPLVTVLRRFNVYSNNDIERLSATVGPPDDLSVYVGERLGPTGAGANLATLSGLGQGRLTPRQVVRLVQVLREACAERGLELEDVLPVAGCDPGTLRSFPRLGAGPRAGALVAKTGTLTSTDGGVAGLAGIARTARGPVAFCVVAPAAGAALLRARQAQERWLLDRIEAWGGPEPIACSREVVRSDHDAQVTRSDDHRLARVEGP